MSRTLGLLLISATATLAITARPASAESPFEEAAAKAARMRKLDRLVWALTATCEQGDDLARRQCTILRDGAAAKLRGATLVVDVSASAFQVGGWDGAKKSISLTLRGCVSCTGVEVGGKRWYIVANKATPKVSGDKVEAAIIHETARTFRDEAAAQAWHTQVVPRLRAQMIIQVSDKPSAWHQGSADGIAVAITGYRVWDTCDGSIIVATPDSGPAEADKKTCGAGAVDTGGGDTGPAEVVVAELSKDQILDGLRPALEEARACYETNGVAGDGKVKITIGADGSVLDEKQSGDFVGTPTGKCIDAAIKKATFPRSRKAKTTISYPVTLR